MPFLRGASETRERSPANVWRQVDQTAEGTEAPILFGCLFFVSACYIGGVGWFSRRSDDKAKLFEIRTNVAIIVTEFAGRNSSLLIYE